MSANCDNPYHKVPRGHFHQGICPNCKTQRQESPPKPPIGIKPEWLWKEERMWALINCLSEHEKSGFAIQFEWVEELGELIPDFIKRNTKTAKNIKPYPDAI